MQRTESRGKAGWKLKFKLNLYAQNYGCFFASAL